MTTENFYYHNQEQFENETRSSKLIAAKTLLIQIFASIRSEEALHEILNNVKTIFPQAEIIGATTDGEIKETSVTTDAVVVSVTAFENSSLKTVFLENEKLAEHWYDTKSEETYLLGKEICKSLVSDKTKVIILFADGLNINGEDFLRGVEDSAPDVIVAGGTAGDAAQFNRTYVLSGDGISSHGAVGVAIDSDYLDVMTNYSFNWQGIGRKMRVGKAEKNRVYEIDGRSAVDVYRHYLGDDVADNLPSVGIEFPIIVTRGSMPVARAVLRRLDDDSLVFAGNIYEGDEVQLGFGNVNMILETANDLAKSIQVQQTETCFVYSCMARRRFLLDEIPVELQALSQKSPLAGFFTYGEFYKNDSMHLLNETMTILAMSESAPFEEVQVYADIPQNKMHSVKTTLKALTHLVNQTTLELDSVNDSLERKVAEKTVALQSKIEELELATRVKADFLANMSHEIRTPLNAILGFMQLLGRNETDKARIKQFATVQSAGNSLVTIINDILDFSKIESGKLTLEKRRFYTKKPFKDVSLLFAQKANEEGILFGFSFDKDLPRFSVGDELRIKQILSNLLSNAIKFTPKLGSINVDVIFDTGDKTLVCSVSDTGKGISKNHQKHIFEAFSQADSSTTREFGGTGLGLSITKKLLDIMDGSILLISSINEGSTFEFRIPLFNQVAIDEVAIEEEYPTLQKDVKLRGKVLLVEDNRANQMLMGIFLDEMGLKTVLAVDGQNAYEAYQKESFDLILMDENMPVMNGIESTRKIRQYEQKNKMKAVPIVAVTANVLLGDKEKFLVAGMDDYVAKPIDIEQLKSTLRRYLPLSSPL